MICFITVRKKSFPNIKADGQNDTIHNQTIQEDKIIRLRQNICYRDFVLVIVNML